MSEYEEHTCVYCGDKCGVTNVCKPCSEGEPDFSEAHYDTWSDNWVDDLTPKW